MNHRKLWSTVCLLAVMLIGASKIWAARAKPAPATPLTAAGQKLLAKYSDQLKALQGEIGSALAAVAEPKKAALQKAREAYKKAEAEANSTHQPLARVKEAAALVEHAKGKWIGGANKGIAQAEAALKKATTDAERDAATKDLAKWQTNKEEGIKALKERQAALDAAKADAANSGQANQSAQAALDRARADEQNTAEALLTDLAPFLSGDKLDTKLVKSVVLAEATPRGLAEFAQQGREQEVLVNKLLADDKLMQEMLVAGGANRGKYARAMQIYAAIQQASPEASQGVFHRLALATSLEHAVPVNQTNPVDQTNAPATVDPVKRYLHYEKAFRDGELDPAFKSFSTWEYRMVVNSDAPDQILSWGREMLRTYRPDHIANPDYGWRYSVAVRTEVPYGSQFVKDDLPSLNIYQNIPKDGGVCGRRAFFGRFILRSFGIPVWGVTQKAHAAVSHWTPKGWVVNLGAGFNASWWDKDEAPLGGSEFLLESQARERAPDYLKVLRAQWVSRVLGEQAHNDREQVDGGFWSSIGHYQAVALAASAVGLGPLGQELAEKNEPLGKQNTEQATVEPSDQQVITVRDGAITIPAVAHGKATGYSAAMKSFSGGLQLHCNGGFRTQYVFEAPQAGKYALTAKVSTLQDGQKFEFAANHTNPAIEIAVPYTVGIWQQTRPVEIALVKGQNILNFDLLQGSRAVTVKDFTLTPVK
jgi:hypothetical protein